MKGSSISAGPTMVAPTPSTLAVEHGRVDELDTEVDRAAIPCSPSSTSVDRTGLAEVIRFRSGAPSDQANAADDRLVGAEGEPAVALVLVVEALGQVEQGRVGQIGAFGNRHAHVEVLTGVGHLHEQLGLHRVVAQPRGCELLGRFVADVAHEPAQAPDVDLGEGHDVGAHQVDHVVGHEHAERREGRRRLRHEHALDAELGGDGPRVHRTVAAVGDHRQFASIGAIAGEHLAGGVGHVGVDDAFDAPSGLDDVDAQSGTPTSRSIAERAASTSSVMRPPAKPSAGR